MNDDFVPLCLRIMAMLKDFDAFNCDLNDKIIIHFKQKLPKIELLNTYYNEYLPVYFRELNNCITCLEQLQNDFKLKYPELESDLLALDTIALKFKKITFNDLETLLQRVLEVDYDRALFEYLDITNKLDADLKIEGKKISVFFETFYNRMVHIKANPKPKPQQPEALDLTSSKETTSKPFAKNNFDHVPVKRVLDYFKKELVDTNYLSLVDLQKYLIIAFQDKTAPVEKFTFAKKIKVKVARDIFYRYYTVIAKAGNDNKMIYAKLLGNHFTGFTAKKVFDNFAK